MKKLFISLLIASSFMLTTPASYAMNNLKHEHEDKNDAQEIIARYKDQVTTGLASEKESYQKCLDELELLKKQYLLKKSQNDEGLTKTYLLDVIKELRNKRNILNKYLCQPPVTFDEQETQERKQVKKLLYKTETALRVAKNDVSCFEQEEVELRNNSNHLLYFVLRSTERELSEFKQRKEEIKSLLKLMKTEIQDKEKQLNENRTRQKDMTKALDNSETESEEEMQLKQEVKKLGEEYLTLKTQLLKAEKNLEKLKDQLKVMTFQHNTLEQALENPDNLLLLIEKQQDIYHEDLNRIKEDENDPLSETINLWAIDETTKLEQKQEAFIEKFINQDFTLDSVDIFKALDLPKDFTNVNKNGFDKYPWEVVDELLVKSFAHKIISKLFDMPKCRNQSLHYLTQCIDLPGFSEKFKTNFIKKHNRELLDIFPTTCKKTVTGHTKTVSCIAINPTTGNIISGSRDNTIKIWDSNGNLITILTDHKNTVSCIVIDPNTGNIISGSRDNTIKIWDSSGNLITTLTDHTNAVSCIAIDPNTGNIISGEYDKTIKIWDSNGNLITTLTGHTARVSSIAIDPNTGNIISGSEDNTIKIWDSNGNLITTLTSHKGSVCCLAIDHTNSNIISASHCNGIKIWNSKGKLLKTITGIGQHSLSGSMAIDHTNNNIISGASDQNNIFYESDKVIKIMNSNGILLKTITDCWLNCLAIDPTTGNIISGSPDGTIKIWGPNFSKEIEDLDPLQLILLIKLQQLKNQKLDKKITLHPDWLEIFKGLPNGLQEKFVELVKMDEKKE